MRKEIVAGITTFLTMAYIVVVNPAILSSGTGISFSGALTATVLLAFSMTLLMGLYADLPFAVAPGMGINAFFTFTLIHSKHIPWPQALGIVFWAGLLFLLISLTPLRVLLAQAIPKNLRTASSVGIGLFLTFIGFKNGSIIVSDPDTYVRIAPLSSENLLCWAGVLLSTALLRKKTAFAFLIPIASITLVSWSSGLAHAPSTWWSPPDFQSVFLKLDPFGALRWAWAPAIIAVMFTDLFDSISTFVGIAHATSLVDKKGDPIRLKEGLIVDAWATLTAGLFGTSSGTAYIESAAGIEVGGRTGKTAVVTALCFLPLFFIAPLAGAIPAFATAPVLIVVGMLMFRAVRGLEMDSLEDTLPAYLTIALIPLTFSITQGILWGFVAHTALYAAVGRAKRLTPTWWVITLVAVLLLGLEKLSS